MKILAISGSARRSSTNTALLRTLSAIAPDHIDITVFDGLGALPVFSPDHEGENAPEAIKKFISSVKMADGIIIASPEYVRSLPGGLKNAIDWLVSGDELIGKPITLAHASHRGDDMLTTLRAILKTVSSGFCDNIFFRHPLMNATLGDVQAALQEPTSREAALTFLNAFAAQCKKNCY